VLLASLVATPQRRALRRGEDFHFREGIFEGCRAAQRLDYLLMVVTNQADIARGCYKEANFLELTDWMVGNFAEEQVRISRVYYCGFIRSMALASTSSIRPIASPTTRP
jgi:D-glycero-D-manno-heptose 1,7-bisphosphate phosphatase